MLKTFAVAIGSILSVISNLRNKLFGNLCISVKIRNKNLRLLTSLCIPQLYGFNSCSKRKHVLKLILVRLLVFGRALIQFVWLCESAYPVLYNVLVFQYNTCKLIFILCISFYHLAGSISNNNKSIFFYSGGFQNIFNHHHLQMAILLEVI